MSRSSVIPGIVALALTATSACASLDRPARFTTERASVRACSSAPPPNGGYRDVLVRLPPRLPARDSEFGHVERSYRDSTRVEEHAKQGSHCIAAGSSATPPRYGARRAPSCG